MASTEPSVTEAQEEAVKVLGEEEEDDDDDSSHRPPPPPVVREEELYDMEAAVKKAKKASGTTSQVQYTLLFTRLCCPDSVRGGPA